jgi:defect-in-organelle-trafficking protein DotB
MKNIDKTRPMSLEDDFPGFEEEFGLPNEPRQLTGVEFDRLLEFCASKGASDVTVQTEMPVYAYIEGRNLRITKRPLSASECDTLTNYMYGNNGTAKIRGGDEIDTRHMVTRRERNEAGSMVVKSRLGFRVNVTGCWSQGDENGLQITARTIKTLPPSLAERYVEPAIIEAMFPEQGLVLVCGPTGAGKTELLAGGIRAILEDPNSHKKVITYESPIEFVYDDIRRASAIISQHEIPRHLPSFARGIRNSLRRAPKVILVGETRDAETAQATIEASQTGHVVYSTVHSNSVANTLARLANLFPVNERMTKVFELAESFRLVVVQRLVRRADGKGRIALREYLVFDQAVRDQIRVATSLKEAEHMLAKLVEKKGQTMLMAAQKAFDAGQIGIEIMAVVEAESKSSLIEDLGMDF